MESSARHLVRTAIDRVVSGAGLILLSPILLAAALAVIREDGFPVFFRQERVGRGGKMFRLVKFRSMRSNTSGSSLTAAGDPRLTGVGRTLRKYKIDELPQLWNVLKGDMSLVGPRPEVPQFVDLADPVWRQILRERPGVTGMASLVYRDEEEVLARSDNPQHYYREALLPAKHALNLQYMNARTLATDIKLIWFTLFYSAVPASFDTERILRSFPNSRR